MPVLCWTLSLASGGLYMIYTTFRELNAFLFQVTPWDFTDRFIISAVKIELGTL